MRYYIILSICLLVVVGAGCSSNKSDIKVETNKSGVSTVTNTGQSSTADLFKTASQDANWHIYYPSYIPKAVKMDTNFVWTKTSASMILSNDPMNINLPSIIIKENLSSDVSNSIQTRLSKLSSKENIKINGINGYFGIYKSGSNSFNTVIFSTSDGVDIGLWSKAYTRKDLIKVAESLK